MFYALDETGVGKIQGLLRRGNLVADRDDVYPTSGSDIQWICVASEGSGQINERQNFMPGTDFSKRYMWQVGQIVMPDGRDVSITSQDSPKDRTIWKWINGGDTAVAGSVGNDIYGNLVFVRSPHHDRLLPGCVYPCIRVGTPAEFVEIPGLPREFFVVLATQKRGKLHENIGYFDTSTGFVVRWSLGAEPLNKDIMTLKNGNAEIWLKSYYNANPLQADNPKGGTVTHRYCYGAGIGDEAGEAWAYTAVVRFNFGGALRNAGIRYGAYVRAIYSGTDYAASRSGAPNVEALFPAIVVDGYVPNMPFNGRHTLTASGIIPVPDLAPIRFYIECFGYGSGGLAGAGGFNVGTTPSPGILSLPEYGPPTSGIGVLTVPPTSSLPSLSGTVDLYMWKVS